MQSRGVCRIESDLLFCVRGQRDRLLELDCLARSLLNCSLQNALNRLVSDVLDCGLH